MKLLYTISIIVFVFSNTCGQFYNSPTREDWNFISSGEWDVLLYQDFYQKEVIEKRINSREEKDYRVKRNGTKK